MFRIDTTSGLHGELVELISVGDNQALIIVRRSQTAHPNHAYSTHRVGQAPDGALVAEAGHYDLSLDQARKDLAARAGRA